LLGFPAEHGTLLSITLPAASAQGFPSLAIATQTKKRI
jgi:hypothetical protein